MATYCDDVAGARQNIHFQYGLMWGSVSKTCAFNSESSHRATEGDRAQLWNTERHQAVGEGGGDKVFVGGHAAHFSGVIDRIYFEN